MAHNGWAWILVGALSVQSTGCYKWVEIKPTEVVKLNGSYERNLGAVNTPSGAVTVTEVTVAHVERPDGTLVELKGEFDADITASGETSRFVHPVNSRMHGPFLIVASGNRAATPYVMTDVQKVKISQHDQTSTALAVILGSVGGALLVSALVLSSSSN